MKKSFEEFLTENPYKPTRSFSEDDWKISMFEWWLDSEDDENVTSPKVFTESDMKQAFKAARKFNPDSSKEENLEEGGYEYFDDFIVDFTK